MTRPKFRIPPPTKQEIERFCAKLYIETLSGCWIWEGNIDKDGYGNCTISRGLYKAHRVAYMIHYGADPGDLVVRHYECDNPPCCNPLHLKLGTYAENIEDRDRKGRTAKGDRHWKRRCPELIPRGEKHPLAKLTNVLATQIHEMLSQGMRPIHISRQLNVSYHCVYDIKRKRTWPQT